MGTVVQLASQSEVEQASGVDGQDFEAKRVSFDGLEAQFIGCWDLVILIESLSSNAEDADVFFGNQ